MPTRKGLRVAILHTSNKWGLGQDAQLIEQMLRESNSCGIVKIDTIQHVDPLQFFCGPVKPTPVDIAIHIEIPCRAATPWATHNIVVVNQEWWPMDAWTWAIEDKSFTFVFKTQYARSKFPTIDRKRCRVIPWRASGAYSVGSGGMKCAFLYMIGASEHKLSAARTICSAWDITLPQLTIVGTAEVVSELEKCGGTGIVFMTTVSQEEKLKLQTSIGYHIVASVAEGFGFSFAEAAICGALPLWTALPVYEEIWGGVLGDIGKIPCVFEPAKEWRDSRQITFTVESVRKAVQSLLSLEDEHRIRGALKHAVSVKIRDFRTGWRNLLNALAHRTTSTMKIPPPRIENPPHVAVVTLTYNRKGWWGNMVQNILTCDYPRNKLTWVVADDSDGPERVDSDIIKFQSTHPEFHVKYVSIGKQTPIGEKRNRACAAAPAECSVFMMMDDDDHYPPSSIAQRVAWISERKKECVYCSTLPMYDILRYISAVNVPPLILSPEERVSEATLCFTRKFWETQKFPNSVSIAEGEAFLSGRVEQTAEIPPNGIIVSFIHKGNTTSRRVPIETEANGSHYGFSDEYFSYLCKVGGAI